jgi:hypothetical protein
MTRFLASGYLLTRFFPSGYLLTKGKAKSLPGTTVRCRKPPEAGDERP